MNRKIGTLIAAAVIVVAGIVGVSYAYFTSSGIAYKNIKNASTSAGFGIILPKKLPLNAEVTIDPTYEKTTGVVTTSMMIDSHEVVFSQQKRPNTDLKQIDTEDTFLVNAGSVYVLKGEDGRLQAIVETTKTWIIVNANAKLGVENFKTVLTSLETI